MGLLGISRLLRYRRTLQLRTRWNRRQLEAHQAAALRELRDHAYERSAFYRRFHRGLFDRPLHELPVLHKGELLAHFDELVTDPEVRLEGVRAAAREPPERPYLGRYQAATTAGSTGQPVPLLWNELEWSWILVSYARASEWAGVPMGLARRVRMAVVSSRQPWHQSARVGATAPGRFVPALRLDATEPPAATVARLNEFQPDLLVGYASMQAVLAEEQLAGRLRIRPKGIMSASEVLSPEVRARVRAAYGLDPFDVYAATEAAGIASECPRHRGLHLYEDLVIAEPVDEAGRPVPPGVPSARLLVTPLYMTTVPLLRYELSDSVTLSPERCPCGLPFAMLSSVEGRAEDVLELRARDGDATVRVHPNVFHDVLDVAALSAWQVVEGEDALVVRVAGPRPGFDEEQLLASISAALSAQGARPPPLRLERVDALPRTAAGKLRLVQALPRSR